jgi:hypothetical protein
VVFVAFASLISLSGEPAAAVVSWCFGETLLGKAAFRKYGTDFKN